jgi:4-hydroxy-tetrahydrodipicolinate reductase
MKIALVGYGKMGHAIEQIAIQRGHEIILTISSVNRYDLKPEMLKGIDVAIEFTNPAAAKENVLACLGAGTPVICGTTGWNEGLESAREAAAKNNTAFLHASNFSVGVNIFFEVNKHLAAMMNDQPDYDVILEETHHTQKKDAPSGTAITIAEQIIEKISRKTEWTKAETIEPHTFPIVAHRIENVPGTHSVKYTSRIDDIEIIHTAHNREGFARGAVLAAEFIVGKTGVFSMKDVLGL